jgi:hypothetical protein
MMTDNVLALLAQKTGKVTIPGTKDGWTHRLQVHGSTGRIYVVSMNISQRVWGCSCAGWCTRRYCHHLTAMLPVLTSVVPGSRAAEPLTRTKKVAPKAGPVMIGSSNAPATSRKSRLPEGEAERRRKARAQAMFDGSRYSVGTPGSEADWATMAAAFASEFVNEAHTFTGKLNRRSTNTDLAALGLTAMPSDQNSLHRAWRTAGMAAFRDAGFSDTAPDYVAAFRRITDAYDKIKRQQRW